MEKNNFLLTDKDLITDINFSLTYLTELYSSCICQSNKGNIRSTFVKIHSDCTEIQEEILEFLLSRGWIKNKSADESQIKEVKNSFLKKPGK